MSDRELPSSGRGLAGLAGGTLWGVGGRICGRAAALAAGVLAARRFGPAQYGLYAIGLVVARLGGFAATLGLDRGLLRFASPEWDIDPGRARSTIRRSLTLTLAAGCAVALLTFALARPLSALFGKPGVAEVIALLSPALLLIPLLRVTSAATTVNRKVRSAIVAEEIVQPAIYVTGAIFLFAIDARLRQLVLLYCCSHLGGLAVAAHFLWRMFRSFVPKAGTPSDTLARFSLVVHTGSLLAVASAWGDRIIVSALLPPHEVGIYNGAGQLAFAFDVLATGIAAIVLPLVASLHAAGETEELRVALRAAVRWSAYFAVPPFLVMCLEPGTVITVILGAPYAREGALPLAVLSIAHLLNVTGVGFWLQMTDGHRAWAALSAAGLVAQILGGWLLIPRYGLLGAAVTALCALAMLNGLGLVTLWRRSRLSAFDWPASRVLLSAAVAAGALLLLGRALPFAPLVRLVIIAPTTVVAFYGALVVLGVHPEDRALLATFRNRIARRAP